MWFQNRRAKWRKKENTKKGPGRPAHNAHPTTCSGEPMEPEEIARRELERLEKRRRKQERKLLRAASAGSASGSARPGGVGTPIDSLLLTPGGSDSDSGVSHSTDGEATPTPPHRRGQPSVVMETSDSAHYQQQQQQQAGLKENQASGGGVKVAKPSPFSVESLLSDTPPRRKAGPGPMATAAAEMASPGGGALVGKGHFLLYPITQPLGFLVPQTSVRTAALEHRERNPESGTASTCQSLGGDLLTETRDCDSANQTSPTRKAPPRPGSSPSSEASSPRPRPALSPAITMETTRLHSSPNPSKGSDSTRISAALEPMENRTDGTGFLQKQH